ncbi:MAG: peroxiredoxin [Pseudomonadota bacterium]|nr:peroxiredoxin [Pseudomonadota bacterium]
MLNKTIKKISTILGLAFSMTALGNITIGEPAPEFNLQDQNGAWHSIEKYRGQWIALYFYPKDDTPGCTKEACSFRDNIFAFDELNAVVLGVSLDDIESHDKFAEKYSLPFSILADTEKEAAAAFGVLMKIGPLTLAKRQSFLINPKGNIVKHYKKVNPETHSKEILSDLSTAITKETSGEDTFSG